MHNPTRRPEILVFEAEAKSVLPVAESFTRQGFRVVVASSHRYCMGFYSRWSRERILMPDQIAQPEACRDFLLDLVKRRRFEMIVPLGDEVTQLVCSCRDEFMKYTKLVLVPYETFMIGRDKVETMKAAAACGVPIPKTYDPAEQSLDAIARDVDYPALVKPAVSNGARGICFVHDKNELVARYNEVAKAYGRTFIQEFIPHEGMQYKTEMLLDHDSKPLASFAYAKIRFYPPVAGSSTLNRTVDYPEMVAHAQKLAQHIGWFGMCDFDFIYDVRDRQVKLMEINPRVTDTIRVAQLAGIDFFRILYQVAYGKKVKPTTDYRKGVYMRFLPGELMWFLTAKGRRFKTEPGFFRTFFLGAKCAVASWSDPGPIMGYLLENVVALCDREQRRYRFRLTSGHPTKNG